jgi:HAD superfamily hydrolase (TIGR01490 family)
MKIVLFDFDKTLTTKDSFIEFLKFAVSKPKLFLKSIILLPSFVFYKVGGLSSEKFKKKVLLSFFKGWTDEKLSILGEQFSKDIIPQILNKEIVLKLQNHISNGDKVVIASGSLAIWLKPWTNNFGVDLISTKLSFKNNVFSGKLDGKNCIREEKRLQIIKRYNLDLYSEVICYGNKGDDNEMLSLATSNNNRNII